MRLKLVFQDDVQVRDPSYRKCWLSVNTNMRTVADLAYIIGNRFMTAESCRLGFILSIEGFGLPSFEVSLSLYFLYSPTYYYYYATYFTIQYILIISS